MSHLTNQTTTTIVSDRQNSFFIRVEAQHSDRHLFFTSFILAQSFLTHHSWHLLLVPTCSHTPAHLFSTLHRCWLSTAGTQNPPLYLSLLPTTSPSHLGSSRSHTILSRCRWPSFLGFPGQSSPPHYRSQCHPQTSWHHNSPWRFLSTLVCSVMCNSRSHTVRPRGVCITNRGGVEVFQSYTHTQPTLCFYSPSHLLLFCPVLKFEY